MVTLWQSLVTNRGSYKIYLIQNSNTTTYVVLNRAGNLVTKASASTIQKAKNHFNAYAFTALVGA